MSLKFVLAPCLLFYGYQTNLFEFAIPMALLWQSQFFIQRRWDLSKKDLYQISDLTSLAGFAVLLFLFNNRAEYHFLLTLFQWLPLLFFPLVLIINFSTTDRLSLDILFFSLRKQKQNIKEEWQQDHILFALLLLASASNGESTSYFLPISFVMVLTVLFQQKAKKYPLILWLSFAAIIFTATILVQLSIRAGHVKIKQEMEVWISNWIQQRNNPLKTRTAMGSIGELKLSDRILFRLEVAQDTQPPELLQEAIYDLPSDGSWTLMQTEFKQIEPVDDFKWQINKTSNKSLDDEPNDDLSAEARIFLEFESTYSLVPVPPGIQFLNQIPAQDIHQNLTGTIKATGLVRAPDYRVSYRHDVTYHRLPEPADLYIPDSYNEVLDRSNELKGFNKEQPLASLEAFFLPYRYSLYQETEGAVEAFDNFLSRSRAGHCEFFATASVLILRKMGIPARYVVGYAVQEYDPLFNLYIVRQRHAHAWAQAYVNGRWQVVDHTPSQWLDFEAKQQLIIQPLFDLFTNSIFAVKLFWHELDSQTFEKYFYLLALVLAGFIALRIFRSKQVVFDPVNEESLPIDIAIVGKDSPFYSLERLIIDHIQLSADKRGSTNNNLSRKKSETFEAWLVRVALEELTITESSQLLDALNLHNGLRFNSGNINTSDLRKLEIVVERFKNAWALQVPNHDRR